MPNIASAKKRLRQTKKRTTINRSRLSRLRNAVRKVEAAIAGGDREAALKALSEAEPNLVRGAQKGVIHRNTAQRKVSRLTRRIDAMSP